MSLVKHALVAVSVTVLVLRGSRAVEKIGKAFVRLCRRAELPIVASQNPYVAVSLYPEKEGSVVHPSPTGDGDHAQIDPGARTQKKKDTEAQESCHQKIYFPFILTAHFGNGRRIATDTLDLTSAATWNKG